MLNLGNLTSRLSHWISPVVTMTYCYLWKSRTLTRCSVTVHLRPAIKRPKYVSWKCEVILRDMTTRSDSAFLTLGRDDGNSSLRYTVPIWNILWCVGKSATKLFRRYQLAFHYLYIHDKNSLWSNERVWHAPTVCPEGEISTRYKAIITS